MPEGFGFKAWISTEDDEPLPEYSVEMDLENKVITCWVPSEAGKKFKILWNNLVHYTKDTAGHTKVDGVGVGTSYTLKSNTPWGAPSVKEDVVTSPTSVRKFVFSTLKLIDDVSLLGVSSGQHVGSISLELQEVKVGELRPATVYNIHEQNSLHEKVGKGLVHKVGFAPEEASSKQHRNVNRLQSFGTFVFKYRPFDVLQANGIAPTSKKCTSEQHDRSSDSSKKDADSKKKGSDNDVEESKKTKDVQSGNKRKLDDIKKNDDGEDGKEAKEKEREHLRARIRKLEREQELEELRERLREIEDS